MPPAMLGRSNTSRRVPTVSSLQNNPGNTLARSPPSDALTPGDGVPKPTDVLVARLHELKRLAKSLAAFYGTLGHAHEQQGKTLAKVASDETLRLPWLEQNLFLPPKGAPNGEGGWAELVGQLKEGTDREAGDHYEVARIASAEVVEPLKQLRGTIKQFIADLEKHVTPLVNEVTKSRELSFHSIQALTSAVGTYTNSPLTVTADQDPFLVRAKTELQMRDQVLKENELLAVVKQWQQRAKAFEFESFGTIARAVQTWEVESQKRFGSTRAASRDITARLDRLHPEVEWQHFVSLNYLLPEEVPTRNPEAVDYPEKNHSATKPIKEGVLGRRKRVVKSWKDAYFVLSSAGFLHEYPDARAPLSAPSVSLFLPNCVVTPVTDPEPGKDRFPTFTVSGRRSTGSGSMRGALGMQHSDVARSYRARSRAEALEWWTEIDKLSKSPHESEFGTASAEERQGPGRTAVQRAGLPAEAAAVPVEGGEGAGLDGETAAPAAAEPVEATTAAGSPGGEVSSQDYAEGGRGEAVAPAVGPSAAGPAEAASHEPASSQQLAVAVAGEPHPEGTHHEAVPVATAPVAFMRLNEPASSGSLEGPDGDEQSAHPLPLMPPLVSAPSYTSTAPPLAYLDPAARASAAPEQTTANGYTGSGQNDHHHREASSAPTATHETRAPVETSHEATHSEPADHVPSPAAQPAPVNPAHEEPAAEHEHPPAAAREEPAAAAAEPSQQQHVEAGAPEMVDSRAETAERPPAKESKKPGWFKFGRKKGG